MAEVIFKYQLHTADSTTLQLPIGARPLCIQVQGGNPCLWVKHDDPEGVEEWVDRTFVTIGTGHPIPDEHYDDKYIGTYQLLDGALVFHLFERSM